MGTHHDEVTPLLASDTVDGFMRAMRVFEPGSPTTIRSDDLFALAWRERQRDSAIREPVELRPGVDANSWTTVCRLPGHIASPGSAMKAQTITMRMRGIETGSRCIVGTPLSCSAEQCLLPMFGDISGSRTLGMARTNLPLAD